MDSEFLEEQDKFFETPTGCKASRSGEPFFHLSIVHKKHFSEVSPLQTLKFDLRTSLKKQGNSQCEYIGGPHGRAEGAM